MRLLLLLCASFALQDSVPNVPESFRRADALSSLGRKMFFDPALSASGKLACASCHDPAFAYGPPPSNAPVSPAGIRATPSLRYLQKIPQFTEHYFDSDTTGDDSIDNGPTGGLTWDGRVDRGRDQARIPLLSSHEMANRSEAAVVAAVRKTAYAAELTRLGGDAFNTILEAFEAWEQEAAEFYPYSSKYDAYLAGTARLTEPERRGLRLFTDPAKGNCARCHIATRSGNGAPPQFTDYGLIALGVPRNPKIAANADPAWFDLGMCGPLREDLRTRDEYCGRFMTPTLRNVATRRAFFHNGAVRTLKEAIKFYVDRDTKPDKFNDLPPRYRVNAETEAPFGRPIPALADAEIDDIATFLQTLTDVAR